MPIRGWKQLTQEDVPTGFELCPECQGARETWQMIGIWTLEQGEWYQEPEWNIEPCPTCGGRGYVYPERL